MTMNIPRFPAFTGLGNDALIGALNDLVGFNEAQTGLCTIAHQLAKARADLLAATESRAQLVQRVADSTRAGKRVSAGFAGQAREVESAVHAAGAVLAVLGEVEDVVAQDRDQVLDSAPATLLEHLDLQLTEALTEARSLGLGTVDGAQEAIDAGLVDAWQRFVGLSDVHDQIRSAQRLVAMHLVSDHNFTQLLDTFGAVRNFADLFPAWYDRQRMVTVVDSIGDAMLATPPWPEGDGLSGLWRYAVEHSEAELWVPTPAELHNVHDAALADARVVEDLRARDEAGLRLTDEERAWLDRRGRAAGPYVRVPTA